MYTNYLSVDMILFGLRFAFKRSKALSGGYLSPWSKKHHKKGDEAISRNQAEWRLNNWKSMISRIDKRDTAIPLSQESKKRFIYCF